MEDLVELFTELGIQLKNSDGDFRNTTDILKDLSEVSDSISRDIFFLLANSVSDIKGEYKCH